MTRSTLPLVLLVLLGVATAGCDLATKRWATRNLSVERTSATGSGEACALDPRTGRVTQTRAWSSPIVVVPDALDLVYTENCAGGFGALHQLPAPTRRSILLVGNLIAAIALLMYARRSAPGAWLPRAGVALILAGAFGNAFDRLTRGFVVDFIHAHWHALEWPVFNVADIAITIGIILMLAPPRFDPGLRTDALAASPGSS